MAWGEGQTLGARWEQACDTCQHLHRHWQLGQSYSGFAEALVRESRTLVAAIVRRFQRIMQQQAGAYWMHRGWPAFAVDGTRIEAPHTADNEAGLGCAGRNKTAPQVFLTTLWHLELGLPWDLRVGPGTSSERVHAKHLIDGLPNRSLLVADAGFVSYSLCRKLIRKGHAFLLRVGSNVHLLTELGYYHEESDGVVYLWPLKHRACPPLVLRLIVLKRGKQTVYLLTNVLDQRAFSDENAADFYAMRWGEEVYHRSFKQTLQRRKLLSRTPQTCLAEAQWTVLGLWLLGLMSVTPGIPQRRHPRRWSVARSRDAVRRAMGDRPAGRHAPGNKSLQRVLLAAVHDHYLRRGSKTARNYPRKKQEKPPGPPKTQAANSREIKRAKTFPPPKIELRWTA
jgi:hypothetical protein